LPAPIELAFEIWELCTSRFVNGADIERDAAPPPVIVHCIADDLHEERARVANLALLPARFNNLQRHLLCQVVVVHRKTGALSYETNEQSNFGRIDVHVTNLREVRLYLA
ncbi:MAG TPA: hypothetical protein VFO86_12105, partial [Terriglobia bacterium]|nr:hypothetical protein [Terriglobia bacterium]